jgi:hypothetical protein
MAERIAPETAAKWSQVAAKLKQISELACECRMILMLELEIVDGKPMKIIETIEDSASGQSYMFTPQTEWTGGDSSNPKNFKETLPHVAR